MRKQVVKVDPSRVLGGRQVLQTLLRGAAAGTGKEGGQEALSSPHPMA